MKRLTKGFFYPVFAFPLLLLFLVGCSDPLLRTGGVSVDESNFLIVNWEGDIATHAGLFQKRTVEAGVCWDETEEPIKGESNFKKLVSSNNSVSSDEMDINLFKNNTLYYVRAYAILNNKGKDIVYGNAKSFVCIRSLTTKPVVATSSVTAIKATAAVSGGTVTSTGGATVTAVGVIYGTTSTALNLYTTNTLTKTAFTSSITGLTANTTYYLRAYATNIMGTSYGDLVSFKTTTTSPNTPSGPITPTVPNTPSGATTPTLSPTMPATAITTTGASSGGNVSNSGGAPITAKGICYGTINPPTIADSKTIDGSGVGPFTSNITGLLPNTVYYVRSYATNSNDTGYGTVIMFTTLP